MCASATSFLQCVNGVMLTFEIEILLWGTVEHRRSKLGSVRDVHSTCFRHLCFSIGFAHLH